MRVLLLLVLALPSGTAPTPLSAFCLRGPTAFQLRYLHSVERTPVIELYRVRDGALVLEGMRFRSLGWGLPSEGYVREDGWFVVSGLAQPVGVLRLRVSRLTRHTLVVGHRVLLLYRLVPEGGGVVLSVGPVRGCPRALRVDRL